MYKDFASSQTLLELWMPYIEDHQTPVSSKQVSKKFLPRYHLRHGILCTVFQNHCLQLCGRSEWKYLGSVSMPKKVIWVVSSLNGSMSHSDHYNTYSSRLCEFMRRLYSTLIVISYRKVTIKDDCKWCYVLEDSNTMIDEKVYDVMCRNATTSCILCYIIWILPFQTVFSLSMSCT